MKKNQLEKFAKWLKLQKKTYLEKSNKAVATKAEQNFQKRIYLQKFKKVELSFRRKVGLKKNCKMAEITKENLRML